MREIKFDDRTITVRPLTVAEVKKLADCGFGYAVCIPTLETANAARIRPLEIVLDPVDLEYLENRPLPDSRKVWAAIIKETYGDPEEEKNLPGTSDGTQTAKE